MSFQSPGHFSLRRALATSLLAHGLLLWPAAPEHPEIRAPHPLLATLRAEATATKTRSAPGAGAGRAVVRALAAGKAISGGSTAAEATRSPASGRMEGPDAEELRGYRLSLARAAATFKHYPQQAVESGWQGSVEIRVDIAAAGGAEEHLLTSSGLALADQAAEEMIRRALPTTPLPESLQGRAFSLILPIVFELAE